MPLLHALVGLCRVLYKLDGPDCEDFQVGLTEEDMRALDALSLEQLLVQLKRAKLDHRQGKSKFRGVEQRHNGKWRARWGRNKRSTAYTYEEEAARAYDRFALEEEGRCERSAS